MTKEDKEFRKFIESLPDKHWAKYDLSAVRLGWDSAIEMFKLKECENGNKNTSN